MGTLHGRQASNQWKYEGLLHHDEGRSDGFVKFSFSFICDRYSSEISYLKMVLRTLVLFALLQPKTSRE